MVPDFRLYVTDETEYWRSDIVEAAGGGISAVYLYDTNRAIHCCEITPSYEMNLMAYVPRQTPEDEEKRDELDEHLREGVGCSDAVSYFHCRTIDNRELPTLAYADEANCFVKVTPMSEKEWEDCLDEADGDEEEAYQYALDATIEYLNCNGYW